MNSAGREKTAGFTLLEMVIAIGIFAVIASIIYPATQRFVDARDQINAKAGNMASLQNTMLFLENDLRFSLDRQVRDGYGDPELSFSTEVESDEIFRLTTAYPDIAVYGNSVPKRVAWIYDGTDLLRRSWRVLDRVTDTDVSTRLMLEGVEDIDVRFARRDTSDIDWSTSWNDGEGMPVAIEVTLELQDGETYRRVVELPGGIPVDEDDGDQG